MMGPALRAPPPPAARGEGAVAEEGAEGSGGLVRVRTWPGGHAVGVGAPGSPTSRQRRHCRSHD